MRIWGCRLGRKQPACEQQRMMPNPRSRYSLGRLIVFYITSNIPDQAATYLLFHRSSLVSLTASRRAYITPTLGKTHIRTARGYIRSPSLLHSSFIFKTSSKAQNNIIAIRQGWRVQIPGSKENRVPILTRS